jgi:hypothetical protein
MKYRIISLLLILVISLSFAYKGDIFPNNNKGFFIQLANIGYSWGNSEIKMAPLNTLLSDYNISYRVFLNKNSVTQLSLDYYDINKILGYLGLGGDLGNIKIGVSSAALYNHSIFYFNNFSIKSQISIGILGININSTTSSTKVGVYGVYTKDSLQLGYYIDNDKEVFTSLEGGKVLSILVQEDSGSNSYQDDINSIKNNSFYAIAKAGIKWYYTPYSIFEIGYRVPIAKSLLASLQGYGLLDYVYNSTALINTSSEESNVNIPFITTNYYINFSMAF